MRRIQATQTILFGALLVFALANVGTALAAGPAAQPAQGVSELAGGGLAEPAISSHSHTVAGIVILAVAAFGAMAFVYMRRKRSATR